MTITCTFHDIETSLGHELFWKVIAFKDNKHVAVETPLLNAQWSEEARKALAEAILRIPLE